MKNNLSTLDKKENFFLAYILLKIQNGDWKENKKIPSERILAQKLSYPQSFIHNCLIDFKKLNLVFSKKNQGWYVAPLIAENILGFEPYQNLFASHYLKENSQNQTIQANKNYEFNSIDLKIIREISGLHKLNLKNFFAIKKSFYRSQINKVSHVMYYMINNKRILKEANKFDFGKNLLKSFANNGLAVVKRIKKIVGFPIANLADDSKEQNFQIILYNVAFDQYGDLLFISKTIFYDYEHLKAINYFYGI